MPLLNNVITKSANCLDRILVTGGGHRRLPRPGVIPSDSALGEKRNTVRSYRLTVREILPAVDVGIDVLP